jgi:GTP-binding protein EngB required for normal cell division
LSPEEREFGVSGRVPRGFRLVVAANKSDLLPRQATSARLEAWARRRMAQGGLPRASAVHVVSSERGTGVKELLAELQAAVGTRGDVWVVGAQNAGKSSLINAMRRAAGLPAGRHVTAAALPGTTLGVVSVPSLLPKGCKMLDTPGVPHAFQLSAFMTPDEVRTLPASHAPMVLPKPSRAAVVCGASCARIVCGASCARIVPECPAPSLVFGLSPPCTAHPRLQMRMLLPRRPLRPRTYRIGAGQSVSLGAVARIDVLHTPGATLYLTVWASDDVTGHMGKTERAAER